MNSATLSFNAAFGIVGAGHYMLLTYPEQLAAAFRSYRHKREKTWAGSIWFRRVDGAPSAAEPGRALSGSQEIPA